MDLEQEEAERSRKRRLAFEEEERLEEEDDYYDRSVVGGVAQKKQNSGVETFESLSKQFDIILEKLEKKREELEDARQKQQLNGAQGEEADEEVDELDAFMSTVETGLRNETVEKLEREVQTLEQELQRLERLVEIARPAWVVPAKPAAAKSSKNGEGRAKTVSFRLEEEDAVEIREAKPEAIITPMTATLEKEAVSPKIQSPKKVTTATAAAPRRPNLGPSMTPEQYAQLRAAQEQKQKSNGANESDPANFVEPEEDVTEWVPPSNQRGDGTTALNDKFGY
jgi:hypothetical protein